MFDKWQAPDRDSPSIDVDFHVKISEQLNALLKMEGYDGYDEDAVKLRTGQGISRPRRWHLMFERMGLLYRVEDVTLLTELGKALLKLASSDPKLELAQKTLHTLSRYQLKNPVDEEADTYPEDCDIHPYWAIWKACDELDGKLHWDELNRELMRVLRHEHLDATIKKISHARTQQGYDPIKGGTASVPLSPRCYEGEATPQGRNPDGQVRDQRTTPWFKRASLGEFLMESPGSQGNGYWTIRPEFRELIHEWVSKGPPPFQYFASERDWYRFISGEASPVPDVSLHTMVESVSEKIESSGLQFSRPLLLRFLAAAASKRFLILTGLAGSGKTKLAQALAQWISPRAEEHHYSIIPIGADWTGNENVLGYPDGLRPPIVRSDGIVEKPGSYIMKPALQLILRANNAANSDIPHFLILDEMNLSHVERYFADLLSAIESNEGIPLYEGEIRTSEAESIPRSLRLPENLFIIGTVNVDETTYMFSPKVLDRASVIEFRMAPSGLVSFLGSRSRVDLSKLAGEGHMAGFGKALVAATRSSDVGVPEEVRGIFERELLLFFNVLQSHGVEFGYRVVREASRYVYFYKILASGKVWSPFIEETKEGAWVDKDEEGRDWFVHAMDSIVVQKFLPKLHGSRAKLGPLLRKLWFLCINDDAKRGVDPLKAAELSALSTEKSAIPTAQLPPGVHYPLSSEKIYRMWRLLDSNGFTSFAEA